MARGSGTSGPSGQPPKLRTSICFHICNRSGSLVGKFQAGRFVDPSSDRCSFFSLFSEKLKWHSYDVMLSLFSSFWTILSILSNLAESSTLTMLRNCHLCLVPKYSRDSKRKPHSHQAPHSPLPTNRWFVPFLYEPIFWTFHINEIVQYVTFCVGFVHLAECFWDSFML